MRLSNGPRQHLVGIGAHADMTREPRLATTGRGVESIPSHLGQRQQTGAAGVQGFKAIQSDCLTWLVTWTGGDSLAGIVLPLNGTRRR